MSLSRRGFISGAMAALALRGRGITWRRGRTYDLRAVRLTITGVAITGFGTDYTWEAVGDPTVREHE